MSDVLHTLLASRKGNCALQVHVYYRALAKPIASKLFSSPSSPSEGPQFISAVCWKPSNQILLAANSQGCIKIMRLAS